MTEFRKLTSEEIFHIFKEEHRLCSPLSPEADPDFDLQPSSTVAEWLDARHLLPWMELRENYNDWYSIEIPIEEWRMTAGYSNEKTMQGVFDLIASHAKIEIIKSVKLFGQDCLSAAVFKSIKKNLETKGIDASDLLPSSRIEPILKNNFSDFIVHINKNFTGILPEIKESETTLSGPSGYAALATLILFIGGFFWSKLFVVAGALLIVTLILSFFDRRQFLKRDGMLTVPGIVTFRDLVNRIVESKNQAKAC